MGHDSPASTFRNLAMTMSDWRDALDLRIMAAGLNAHSVSLAAGLGPTAVRDILSGRSRQPRIQTLDRIGQVLGCTVEEILNPPDDLDQILSRGRHDRSTTTPSTGLRRGAASGSPPFRAGVRGDPCAIPILDLEAIEDEAPPDRASRGELALPRALIEHLGVTSPAALTVRDDAMAPTLHRGDLLVIDRAVTRPRRDGIYVLFRPGQITIRRLHIDPMADTLDIIADNSAYPSTADVSPAELQILGIAVWQGRAL